MIIGVSQRVVNGAVWMSSLGSIFKEVAMKLKDAYSLEGKLRPT